MAKIDPPQSNYQEWFFELWRGRGLRDDQVWKKWHEHLQEQEKGK